MPSQVSVVLWNKTKPSKIIPARLGTTASSANAVLFIKTGSRNARKKPVVHRGFVSPNCNSPAAPRPPLRRIPCASERSRFEKVSLPLRMKRLRFLTRRASGASTALPDVTWPQCAPLNRLPQMLLSGCCPDTRTWTLNSRNQRTAGAHVRIASVQGAEISDLMEQYGRSGGGQQD